MAFSRKKSGKRSVLDIHGGLAAVRKRPIRERIIGRNVLDLKPGFARRHPFWAAVAIAVIAIAAYWGVRRATTRAEAADFYPLTCLGSWQNPANAQGEPESLTASGTAITALDSAVYDPASNPLGQIYCGAFIPPSYETEGNLTSVAISLAWDMPGTATGTVTTTDAAAPLSPSSTPQTAATSSTSTSLEPFLRGLASIFSVAFADTTGTATTVQTSSGGTTIATTTPAPVSVPEPTSSAPAPTSSASTPTATITTQTPATTISEPTSTPSSTSVIVASTTAATTTAAAATTTTTTTTAATEPTTTAATATQAPPSPDDNFMKVSYSLDGESWIELSEVSPSDWRGFTANIPVSSWDDLKKLQVKIEGVQTSLSQIPTVYLDGMVVEAHYEIPPAPPLPVLPGGAIGGPAALPSGGAASGPVIVLPSSTKPVPVNQGGSAGTNFNADQAPTFDFNLNTLQTATSGPTTSSAPVAVPAQTVPPPTSTPSSTTTSTSFTAPGAALSFFFHEELNAAARALSSFGRIFTAYAQSAGGADAPAAFPTANNPIVTEIFGPDGKLTTLQPATLVTGGNLRVILPTPGRAFRPGMYVMKLLIWQNGQVFETQSDFSWGVLVVDFDKSIYALGDEVHAGLAVLDNAGNTICGAPVSMTVTSPTGATTEFSDSPGSPNRIATNSTCGPNNVTNAPDYSASLPASTVGTWQVSVTAATLSGTRTITDHFEVQDPPLFDVTRSEPVRIFPPVPYQVSLYIKANAGYNGDIVETVPSSFAVTAAGATQAVQGDALLISWPVHLKKGDSVTLPYSFEAPDVSPELYKIGPLTIGSWQESRQWQIAADAVTQIFITISSSTTWTVPSDWNSASNTIELVAGGAGGIAGAKVQGAPAGEGGGGGGAYSKISNFSASPGASVNVGVGAGGGSDAAGAVTYFNWNGSGSTSTCSATTMSACAAAGGIGSGTTGGAGGATANSVGSTTYAGGTGGTGGGKNGAGGGGGGAAGLNGAGGNASGSTGGTGDSGHTAAGANGTEWSSVYGSGGGGAGGAAGGAVGTSGGLSGAGGGGGSGNGNAGGSGQNGIIVITYTPSIITVGNGTQAANETIGPGMSATTSDVFTLTTNGGTSSITSVTVNLPIILGVYQVQVTDASGATVYGSSTDPGFPTVTINTTGMNVSTTASTFHLAVQTFPGTFVPGDPPGSDFTVTSTVAGWTDSRGLPQSGSNTTSSVITIDNSAPNEAANASGTLGTSSVALSWTNPSNSDFASTIVLRATSSLVGMQAWSTSQNQLPTAEYDAAGVAYNGYLYVMGGYTSGGMTSSIFYAPVNSTGSVGSWSTSQNQLPSVNDLSVGAAYNGHLYVIGGAVPGGATSSVYYAPINSTGSVGSWSTSQNQLPTSTDYAVGAAYNGYLYVMGGNTPSGATSSIFYAPLPPRPVAGTAYAVSNTIPFGNVTATVACVVASPSNSCVDSGLASGQTYYYDIYTEDTYKNYSVGSVPSGTPFGGPTVSCSVSTTTSAFGTLSSSAVLTSTPSVTSTFTCSDSAGCVLDISDRGNTSTPGLYNPTAPHLILSTSTTLTAGAEGYGIQAATTSAGSGSTLTLNPSYALTGNAIGGLSTTSVVLASSTNTFSNRQVVVTHLASISTTTYAGSYSDIITYSCLGN